MKAELINEGGIYWTFIPVIEGEEVAREEAPNKPRQVMAVWDRRHPHDHPPVLKLHGFDRETKQINHDSNATAYPTEHPKGEYPDVFPDEATALVAYRQAAIAYAVGRIKEGQDILDGFKPQENPNAFKLKVRFPAQLYPTVKDYLTARFAAIRPEDANILGIGIAEVRAATAQMYEMQYWKERAEYFEGLVKEGKSNG